MRRSQHNDNEILSLLDEAGAGVSIAEICSTARISVRTFYRWRKRFGGLTSPALQHMKELEIENQRLRAMLDKLSERRPVSPAATPRLGGSVRPRLEFGCSPGPSAGATAPPRGASLGRFAAVRGVR